ncbi:hypothetical protein E5676_scaffold121G00720 [Cucumis melo var. makuwa]|uniref:Uncharacterized protein n=1 Tax=Cucumis melo var. makuwa TaxID=1194695 RepID=A0A5D3BWF9_CUCMM|nr:hypothetical protein E6C27_scaffold269G001580 [Cucumis melo var. makuwa]TYK03464.1 hypothetical protein E5676_scaffold121G00720 [Cucumis melo var. makuwa]
MHHGLSSPPRCSSLRQGGRGLMELSWHWYSTPALVTTSFPTLSLQLLPKDTPFLVHYLMLLLEARLQRLKSILRLASMSANLGRRNLKAEPIPALSAEPPSPFEPPSFWSFPHLSLGRLDQLELEHGISRLKGNYCNLDLGTSLLGKHTFLAVRTRRANLQPIRVVPAWVSFGITTYLRLRSPTGRRSSMDIDMIRVIRRDPRNPIVLVIPPGSLQTSRGRGRGKGKLASDQK